MRAAWMGLARRVAQAWTRVLATALASGLLAACAPLQARGPEAQESTGRVARVVPVTGAVWVQEPDSPGWSEAIANGPLLEGDRLATDPGARVELHLGSSVIRLDGDSELWLARLDTRRMVIELRRGSLALSVATRELAHEIELTTAEGLARPLTGGHYRLDRERETTSAGVWRGELDVRAAGERRRLESDDRLVLRRQDDGRLHLRERDMRDDRFAQWALDEDSRWRQALAQQRHAPPEMTASWQLAEHGHWSTHPEHGPVWLPNAVPAGWAPYRDGQWVWVRGHGWTWVDAAPWGFAPFHYGRWVSWHGRWAWWPGRRHTHPVYQPAVVAWVGGPEFGVSITIGGTPHLGWVPLAPHEPYRPVWQPPPPHRHVAPPYRGHPHPHPRPRPAPKPVPQPVPTGPIMYSNQGVPAAVSVVPSSVLTSRGSATRAAPPVAARPATPPPIAQPPAPRVVATPPRSPAPVMAPPAPRPVPQGDAEPPDSRRDKRQREQVR